MDDEIDESELVEPASISENEVLYSDAFYQLPSLDIAAEDSPSLAAIEAGRVYNALPENCIRLLRIAPGDAESELCCQIRHYALHEQTQYSALSYTWGSGPAEHAITLNGKRIHVRKNLWRFLRQARSSGGQLRELLWIDALCINQSDLNERAQQVHRMPEIYSMAIKAFVWLGPSYENSDVAMRAFLKPPSTWLARGGLLKAWSKPLGTAIYRLCYRSYWTRLWVFQELSMAQQIHLMCGDKVVPFEAFCNLFPLLQSKALPSRQCERLEYNATANSPASTITNQIVQQPRDSSLWNLLIATQRLRCSDSRDKVYALLGVAEGGVAAIVVDYSISVSTLMNAILRNEHSFRPPQSLNDVETQCSRLTDLFGLNTQVLFECSSPRGRCPSPQQSDSPGASSLYNEGAISVWWAAFHGHDDVFRLFLSDRNNDATSFRDQAILDSSHAATEMLRSIGEFHVNIPNQRGQSALHVAALYGREEIARLCLLDDAMNVQLRDAQGYTALDLAALNAHQDVVRTLLDPCHMPVSGVPEYLGQALSYAVLGSGGNLTVVKMLIDTGLIDFSSAGVAIQIAKQLSIPGVDRYWWNSFKGNERLLQGFESDAHWRQAHG